MLKQKCHLTFEFKVHFPQILFPWKQFQNMFHKQLRNKINEIKTHDNTKKINIKNAKPS
jgi:hypothetical protein